MDPIHAPHDDPGNGDRHTAPPVTAPAPRPAGWSSPAPADLGQDGTPAAWLLVWTIVTVKAITLVVTIAIARSWDAGAVMALTTWPWLVAIGALVAGPLLFRYRLRRVRARRAALQRAEWHLDDRGPATDELS
jgi:hypothetical protein